MGTDSCLFCKIIAGQEPADVVLELDDFLVIKNKYPTAPVHVLVLDRQHREKSDTMSDAYSGNGYWTKMFDAVSKTVKELNLDTTGEYEIVCNGPAYAHFQHQHIHILGGYKDGKGART